MTTPTYHGLPCWYELGTTDIPAASEFYHSVLDWSIADSGMEGVSYHLANAPDGVGVAGMMDTAGQEGAPPPNWLIYFGCADCDATAAAVTAAGGTIIVPPSDIPGTGRFSVCFDPQGAAFGILQPAPMEAPPQGSAFDQSAPGHGNWHELMSSDPEAGFAFYADLFGWTKGETMPMGEMGNYQLFQHGGTDIGGMMGLGNSPVSAWLPYFGTPGVQEAIGRIQAGGGAIQHGPTDVPGGAYIAVATDPQNAFFAVVGPKNA